MSRYTVVDETRKKLCAEAFGTEVKIELKVLIKDGEALLECAGKESIGTILHSAMFTDEEAIHKMTEVCLLGKCKHCNGDTPECDIENNAIANWVEDAVIRSIPDCLEFLGCSVDIHEMKKHRIL